jgi:hypothetical protein
MANKYLRATHISVADTPEIIYTVPAANASIVASLRVTNANGATAYVSVTATPASSTGILVLSDRRLAVDETMDVFSGVSFNMQAGDSLTVEATEDDIVFWLSYLEVDRT